MNIKEKYPKYLPIGSVVMLKNATKKLLITGFCIKSDDDSNTIYDYSGCLYPEGVISTKQTPVFNHEQIETIFAIGYSDEEEKEFKKKLSEFMKNTEV